MIAINNEDGEIVIIKTSPVLIIPVISIFIFIVYYFFLNPFVPDNTWVYISLCISFVFSLSVLLPIFFRQSEMTLTVVNDDNGTEEEITAPVYYSRLYADSVGKKISMLLLTLLILTISMYLSIANAIPSLLSYAESTDKNYKNMVVLSKDIEVKKANNCIEITPNEIYLKRAIAPLCFDFKPDLPVALALQGKKIYGIGYTVETAYLIDQTTALSIGGYDTIEALEGEFWKELNDDFSDLF